MQELTLHNGMKAQLDGDQHETHSQFHWTAACNGAGHWIAKRTVRVNGKKVTIYLHREVLGLDVGDKAHTWFRDGNRLNCQRSNLMASEQHTIQIHSALKNKGLPRGVYCDAQGNYRAMTRLWGKYKSLGTYKNVDDAAKAYRQATKFKPD